MHLPNRLHAPAILQTLQVVADPVQFLDTCAQRYGDTFTTRVLGFNSPPVVFFGNPKALQDIFTAPAESFDFGKATHVFEPLMGKQSIILQEGKAHQRQRQLLLPPFHGDRMRAYGRTIAQITQEAIAHWQPHSTIAIHHLMPDITLQIILQVVFGITPGQRYTTLKRLLSRLLEDITQPAYSSLFFFPPLQLDLGKWSPWGNFKQRLAQIDRLIYAEIAERRQQQDSSKTDILSLLLSAKDATGVGMSDEELRDQLVSLLLLGYETTAASLTWAFYWIHSLPSVQSQLRAELASLGHHPTPEQITQLPYLNALTQESLRLYPIALISMPRMLKVPLSIASQEYPCGTVVIPCIYLAHQNPQTYPQPRQFQPERFLARKFTPYEFLPFGGGSRGCIGAAFSLYEMKLILATILSHWQLQPLSNQPVKPVRRGITMVPAGGVSLQVVERVAHFQTPVAPSC